MGNLDEWQEFPAVMENYEAMRNYIMAQAAGLSEAVEMKLELGIEEVLVNIIEYAYDTPSPVWLRAAREGAFLRVDFADHGRPFDPLEGDRRHAEDVPLEDREEGGFGIFLVKKNFDKAEYAYKDFRGKKGNCLSLWLKAV